MQVNPHTIIHPLETWKTAPDALHSPGATWHVLARYQEIDLEMWVCWLITPDKPDGELATCYAWGIRDIAERQDAPEVDEQKPPVSWGTCLQCERGIIPLNQAGICEACVLEAMIDE